ncbi:hypothetical protein CSKR_109114 [Clonorchis sinensis]|uniref:Uncharacterized protein n=1 Tax=Clonorchis sinensis TaxID=79923 RepID=A0A419PZ65_CLOSI|nr:hypothetical protein CSKR_109114 [Clonorchis sinensis]
MAQPQGICVIIVDMRTAQVVKARHLGNLAVSQPSCFLRAAWQLGTGRMLQLNDIFYFYMRTVDWTEGKQGLQTECSVFEKYTHLQINLVFARDSAGTQLNLPLLMFPGN